MERRPRRSVHRRPPHDAAPDVYAAAAPGAVRRARRVRHPAGAQTRDGLHESGNSECPCEGVSDARESARAQTFGGRAGRRGGVGAAEGGGRSGQHVGRWEPIPGGRTGRGGGAGPAQIRRRCERLADRDAKKMGRGDFGAARRPFRRDRGTICLPPARGGYGRSRTGADLPRIPALRPRRRRDIPPYVTSRGRSRKFRDGLPEVGSILSAVEAAGTRTGHSGPRNRPRAHDALRRGAMAR